MSGGLWGDGAGMNFKQEKYHRAAGLGTHSLPNSLRFHYFAFSYIICLAKECERNKLGINNNLPILPLLKLMLVLLSNSQQHYGQFI